jgi:tetratricopeptide (TPR) repeat protein
MALYDQGRFDEAVESYQKAVKLEPDYADAHYNLANALKHKGDLRKAIDSYRASLAINPSDAEVLLTYRNALKQKGELDAATDSYKQVIKIKPDHELTSSTKLHQQVHICDWATIKEDSGALPKLGTLAQSVSPFGILSLSNLFGSALCPSCGIAATIILFQLPSVTRKFWCVAMCMRWSLPAGLKSSPVTLAPGRRKITSMIRFFIWR